MEEAKKPRLLVVEDNEISSRLLHVMLRDTYEIDAAFTVGQAFEKAEAHVYDLVLMDIDLGERRTGVEVMHELRRRPDYAAVPVVACTAYALPGLGDRFLEVGFDGYISKPFTKDQLLDALAVARGAEPAPAELEAFREQVRFEPPPLPESVPQILQLAPDVRRAPDVERLKTILREDPATEAWSVRHAHGPHAPRARAPQIDQMTTLLGFVPVCNLALTELLTQAAPRFDGPRAGRVYEYVLETSLGAATFARHLAAAAGLDDPDRAYTGGLIAQLGRLTLLGNHPDAYARMWFARDGDEEETPQPPTIGQELIRFGQDHLGLGERVASRWELSRALRTVFRHSGRPLSLSAGRHVDLALPVAAGLRAAEMHYRAEMHVRPEGDGSLAGLEDCPWMALLARHSGTPAATLCEVVREKAPSVRAFVASVYAERGRDGRASHGVAGTRRDRATSRTLRALVADPSSVSRRVLCNLVRSFPDAECIEVEDGARALEVLLHDEIDLLVTDWNLPDIDGLMLTRIVRLHPDHYHVPVVMTSADAHPEFVQKAIRARVTDYVVKPISAPDFRAKIEAITGSDAP